MQGCRPGQITYGLLDSPAGLLGYIGPLITNWVQEAPCVTANETKETKGGMTGQKLLELVTLYWITGTIASSFLPYAINRPFRDYVEDPAQYIRQPLGYSQFPEELISPPIHWIRGTGHLAWAIASDRGGHFPGIEVPDVFVAHLRQAFSPGGKAVQTSQSGEPLVPLQGLWDQVRAETA